MTDFQAGQRVTVPREDGSGRITTTYVRREEEDARWDASTQTPRDWHWVQYEEGDGEGLTGLYPRSDISPA
jgi:hypothetical protein